MYEYKDLYTIDFRDVDNFWEFHFIIREALDFPEYCGCNFDAIWDCLTDMIGRPINIEILGLDNARKKFSADFIQSFIDTLIDLKHYADDRYFDVIHITIVNGDKREELV